MTISFYFCFSTNDTPSASTSIPSTVVRGSTRAANWGSEGGTGKGRRRREKSHVTTCTIGLRIRLLGLKCGKLFQFPFYAIPIAVTYYSVRLHRLLNSGEITIFCLGLGLIVLQPKLLVTSSLEL